MDPQWARNLRDECAATASHFFMKQMTGGDRVPIPQDFAGVMEALPRVHLRFGDLEGLHIMKS
jgi:protein gp37